MKTPAPPTSQDEALVIRQRVKLQETNAKLKRLGMRGMTPLPLPHREVEVPGGEVFYGTGEKVVRYFDNAVIGVR